MEENGRDYHHQENMCSPSDICSPFYSPICSPVLSVKSNASCRIVKTVKIDPMEFIERKTPTDENISSVDNNLREEFVDDSNQDKSKIFSVYEELDFKISLNDEKETVKEDVSSSIDYVEILHKSIDTITDENVSNESGISSTITTDNFDTNDYYRKMERFDDTITENDVSIKLMTFDDEETESISIKKDPVDLNNDRTPSPKDLKNSQENSFGVLTKDQEALLESLTKGEKISLIFEQGTNARGNCNACALREIQKDMGASSNVNYRVARVVQHIYRDRAQIAHTCELSLNASERKVMIYTTTLGVIRKTRSECAYVRQIFRNLMVRTEERDVSCPQNRRLFEQKFGSDLTPPQVIINGAHVGGRKEVESLLESGRIHALVANIDRVFYTERACPNCAGLNYTNCKKCLGSKHSKAIRFTNSRQFARLKCTQCVDGLVRCLHCLDDLN